MNKLLMFIRTPSLAFDDRVRKEVNALSTENVVTISAFENFELDISDYHKSAQINRNKLLSRKLFKSGNFTGLKIIEMYVLFLIDAYSSKSNINWLHNFEAFGLVILLGFLKKMRIIKAKIIWDQHELPPEIFLRNKFLLTFYEMGLSFADVNVFACKERGEYIMQKTNKHFEFEVIENFPDTEFINSPISKFPEELNNWIRNEKFYMCQGGCRVDRGFFELVEAAVNKKVKIIFVGPIDEKLQKKCEQKFSEFNKYIFMKKSVPQMQLNSYIRKSSGTIIFYKKDKVNNWLCAPNRFYQSIGLGVKTLTGNNPLFESYKRFQQVIVCDTDGSDSSIIENGLERLIEAECNNSTQNFSFESQQKVIDKIVHY